MKNKFNNKVIAVLFLVLAVLFASACKPEDIRKVEQAVALANSETPSTEAPVTDQTVVYDIVTAPEVPETTTTVETTIPETIPETVPENKPRATVTTNCVNESTFHMSGFEPGLVLYLGLNNQSAMDVVIGVDGTLNTWMRGGPIVNNTVYWTVSTPDTLYYSHGEVPCP